MKVNKSEIKTINIGIELIRFISSLWIVIVHCSKVKEEHKKYLFKRFHVPTFILISFFFYYRHLSNREITKIISRFQRLLIPYILWPIIILLINNALIFTLSFGQYKSILTIKDILIQISIGDRYHKIFWFQFNLLFSSLFLTIISFIFKQNILKTLIVLGIISFYLTISRKNYNFFFIYGISGKNIGSIIELLPIAVIGCTFSFINILSKIKDCSIYFYLILLYILFILFEYDLFVWVSEFRFSTTLLFASASTSLFLLFGSLSFESLENQKIIYIIRYITKFTGGIYYIHPIYLDYLVKISLFFYKRSYISACIIYIMCYFSCFLGSKLFKHSKLKYLFL